MEVSAEIHLAGHLGHLTPDQQQLFKRFRENITKAGLYTPAVNSGGTAPSHDDATLLRFLRARRFDPEKAEKQFSDTEQWRKEHDVKNLYNTFDPVEFEDSRRYYPRWTGRRDRLGRPVYVFRIASIRNLIAEINAAPEARRYQRIVVLHEALTAFVMPLCSYLPHSSAPTPISSVTTIIDLEGVSFTTLYSLRKHLQTASTMANNNYPETLASVAVCSAPSYFSTVWGWLKGWFDEGTRAKIHVLGKDPGPALHSIIHPKDLPKAYGGELDWSFEDEPLLDQEAKEVIGAMPKGPWVFVNGKAYLASEAPPAASPETVPSP